MLNVKKTTALEKAMGRRTRPPFLESLSPYLYLSLSGFIFSVSKKWRETESVGVVVVVLWVCSQVGV